MPLAIVPAIGDATLLAYDALARDLPAIVGVVLFGAAVLSTAVTLVIVTAAAAMMNVSGVEIELKGDIDLDSGPRSMGMGNIATRLAGGIAGLPGVSSTLPANRLGGVEAATGVAAGAGTRLAMGDWTHLDASWPRQEPSALLGGFGKSYSHPWSDRSNKLKPACRPGHRSNAKRWSNQHVWAKLAVRQHHGRRSMAEALPRRGLLAAPLLAAAIPLRIQTAEAAGVDPSMTQVVQADAIPWKQLYNFPEGTAEQAPMQSAVSEPGQYFVLIRWHPGYMSAPHWYETDRLCVVLSGIWWVASGEDFAPERTVPVTAGGFVRRVARTPHYDGVKRDAREPAIIAISGIGPIQYHLTDPSQPGWRRV